MTNHKPQQQGTKLVDHIPLVALEGISLSFEEQEHTIVECPPEVLKSFIEQYTEVEGVSEKQWNDIFMRWRLINFLIEDGALEVQDGTLVEVQVSEPEVEQVTV